MTCLKNSSSSSRITSTGRFRPAISRASRSTSSAARPAIRISIRCAGQSKLWGVSPQRRCRPTWSRTCSRRSGTGSEADCRDVRAYAFLDPTATDYLSGVGGPVPDDGGPGAWLEPGTGSPVRGYAADQLLWWLDQQLWEVDCRRRARHRAEPPRRARPAARTRRRLDARCRARADHGLRPAAPRPRRRRARGRTAWTPTPTPSGRRAIWNRSRRLRPRPRLEKTSARCSRVSSSPWFHFASFMRDPARGAAVAARIAAHAHAGGDEGKPTLRRRSPRNGPARRTGSGRGSGSDRRLPRSRRRSSEAVHPPGSTDPLRADDRQSGLTGAPRRRRSRRDVQAPAASSTIDLGLVLPGSAPCAYPPGTPVSGVSELGPRRARAHLGGGVRRPAPARSRSCAPAALGRPRDRRRDHYRPLGLRLGRGRPADRHG